MIELYRAGDQWEAYGADAIALANVMGEQYRIIDAGNGSGRGRDYGRGRTFIHSFPHSELRERCERIFSEGQRVVLQDLRAGRMRPGSEAAVESIEGVKSVVSGVVDDAVAIDDLIDSI